MKAYLGHYYYMGMLLIVRDVGNQLVAAVPGVPEGYEIVLEPVEGDSFRMHGGPLDGSTVTFIRALDGAVSAFRAGSFEIARIPDENVKSLPVTARMLAPDFELSAEKEAAFAALLQSIIVKADGSRLDYHLPFPIHEFVQYVSAQEAVIFHGSNNTEIETFAPVRKSYELRDETGRGNLQAVYGTHDGLWAMFFAIVDRANLHGSIRNGVMYFHNRQGDRIAVYNFSVNQEQLAGKPWREGSLYFLPRTTFERLKMTEEAYANEWASREAVTPLARLIVQPEDFPFLDRIAGHDDSELLRLGALSKQIRASAQRALLQEDRFTVVLPAGLDIDLDEYIKLQRILMPAAHFSVTPAEGELALEMTRIPPAYRQILSEEYADLLAV